MDPFQLSESAVIDIDGVWLYLLEKAGLATADRIVTEFFHAFYRLARMPYIGHRRRDLTKKEVRFYLVFSYLVIYDPETKPLQILGVLHGKRNVRRILAQRP